MGVKSEKSKLYWCSFCPKRALWNLSQAAIGGNWKWVFGGKYWTG